jgi:type VI secretion system protein ImpG
MKELYRYYDRELGTLNRFNAEFAKAYPSLADRLGMADGACDDPHIRRLVQSCALLNARTQMRLDDSYPEFTEALLSINYPHYLSPFPSVSIACVNAADGGPKPTSVSTIPRGALLHAAELDGVVCKFATVYPLTVAPVKLSKVGFVPLFKGPPGSRLPLGVSCGYQLTLESTAPAQSLAQLGIKTLRVFVDGDPTLCAALRDAFLLRSTLAWTAGAADRPWRLLHHVPITSVGFSPDDAILPTTARAHPAYRLITEYFCAPEKFNFIDIDVASITADLPQHSTSVTLHVALAGVAPHSDLAITMGALSESNLRLGCAPIVNLFPKTACPIRQDYTKTEYPLLADAKRAANYDIYQINSVRLVRDAAHGGSAVEFHPYYSMRHGLAAGRRGRYWIMRRDQIAAVTNPGYAARIALVDIDLDPLKTESNTVSIALLCTNGELPCRLKYGAPAGDLVAEQGSAGLPIRMLRKPSRPLRFAKDDHWRLVSHLTLNHRSLVQDNIEAFTEMLSLYDLPQSPVSARQISGIVGLTHRRTTAWLTSGSRSARAHGIEVRITIDEDAFAGASVHAFAEVLERFFALYVHLNSFVQLIILSSSTGKELIRCASRNGDLQLV